MKNFITTVFCAMMFCFFLAGATLSAQEEEKSKLDNFEEKVSKEEKATDEEKKSDENSDSSDETAEVAVSLASNPGALKTTGIVIYGLFITFPEEDSLLYLGDYRNCYYAQYPYVSREDGLFSDVLGKRRSITVSGHYFYDESNLTGYGVRARFSPHPFFNAEIHFTDLTEELSTRDEHLKLYNVFVNYNRMRLQRWAFWWGLGLKGLQGDKTYNGFAFNLGTEIYPAKPVSLNFSYSGGFINDTYVPEFYGALNVHLNRFAIFAGYQYWSAGSAKIDGILGGVKLFF